MKKDIHIPNLEAKLHWGRIATWLCYGTLLLQLSILNLIDEHGSIASWIVQCVPLLLVLPGMIAQRYKTYSWLCFILLMYFMFYVVEVGSVQLYTWTDATGLSLTVIMFISSMMTSRWLQHWQLKQAQSNSQ